jgi:hypothetical protein
MEWFHTIGHCNSLPVLAATAGGFEKMLTKQGQAAAQADAKYAHLRE